MYHSSSRQEEVELGLSICSPDPKTVLFPLDHAIFPVLFLLFSTFSLSFLIYKIEMIIPNCDTTTRVKRNYICEGPVRKCRLLFQ